MDESAAGRQWDRAAAHLPNPRARRKTRALELAPPIRLARHEDLLRALRALMRDRGSSSAACSG